MSGGRGGRSGRGGRGGRGGGRGGRGRGDSDDNDGPVTIIAIIITDSIKITWSFFQTFAKIRIH